MVEDILLALITGLGSSAVFFAAIVRLRPRVEVSTVMTRSIRDGSISYGVKVINRTRSDLVDVRAELVRIREVALRDGPLSTRYPLTLRTSEMLVLPRFAKDDLRADYAFRFTTAEDLDGLLAGDDHAYVVFRVFSRHSLSGIGRVSRQRFTYAQVVDGQFCFGDTCEVEPLGPDKLHQLRALLPPT